jgi:hypothetical protein
MKNGRRVFRRKKAKGSQGRRGAALGAVDDPAQKTRGLSS